VAEEGRSNQAVAIRPAVDEAAGYLDLFREIRRGRKGRVYEAGAGYGPDTALQGASATSDSKK